jgi:Mn-dependent DtxR family transcriptional regulator
LGWLGEQYGARVDQLELLIGCGPRTVQRTVARLHAAGLVQTRRLLVGEPAWVTPTGAGMAAF